MAAHWRSMIMVLPRTRCVHLIVGLLQVLAVFPTATQAQTCSSQAGFDLHPIALGANASMGDMGLTGRGTVLAGSRGPWVGFGVGATRTDESDAWSSLRAGAVAGYQVPLNSQETVQLCPTFGGSKSGINWGIAVGVIVAQRGDIRLIPSVTLEAKYASPTDTTAPGSQVRRSDIWGVIRLKFGLVIRDQLSLRYRIDIPFADESDDVRVGLGIRFNFP